MSEKHRFSYFYGIEAEQYSFYRIPKTLFTELSFKPLSCEAKLLYGLMLDRMSLSIKNRWIDTKDRVYIIFAIEEIMELLQCGSQKAVKLMQELDSEKGIGLIEKKRLGFGKANVIYVKNFMTSQKTSVGTHIDIRPHLLYGQNNKKVKSDNEKADIQEVSLSQNGENHNSRVVKTTIQEFRKSQFKSCENHNSVTEKPRNQGVCASENSENHNSGAEKSNEAVSQNGENHNSRIVKTTIHEFRKSPSNDTDMNKTDISDTDTINPIESITETPVDAIGAYRMIVCDNISYDALCSQYDKVSVDEILELILEVLASHQKTFRISGTDVNASAVKERYMKLNMFHIQYVFECLEKSTTKIRSIKQYLITSLYNAPITINHYYKAEVRHNMYGK